eukprot:scaffold183981_cov22-Tisochrysis_lutea.AAC.1
MAAGHGQGCAGVHSAPLTLFVSTCKHLQLENRIADASTKRPFLESTNAPHIPKMHWHNVCKHGCHKVDSLAGRHSSILKTDNISSCL